MLFDPLGGEWRDEMSTTSFFGPAVYHRAKAFTRQRRMIHARYEVSIATGIVIVERAFWNHRFSLIVPVKLKHTICNLQSGRCKQEFMAKANWS
jgi:hypothetical protein